MKLYNFVNAYEQSLIALNQEAIELENRIALIERKSDYQHGSRLASRLELYKRQLRGLRLKHRAAQSWISTVAQPIFTVIGKRLGVLYQGFFTHHGDSQASMRFFHSAQDAECSLVLKMTMAQLCTEPLREAVCLTVRRSVVLPTGRRIEDDLSLEATIHDVLTPLLTV